MPWLAPVIGGIATVGGALIGNKGANEAADRASAEARATRDMLAGIALPDIEKQKLLLELPQIMGTYNPAMEAAIAQTPSAMEGISTDPQLAAAQMASLQSLQGLGETGMTAQEMAQLKQMRREVGQQEHAREAGILEDLARRGVSGGGLELAARLKASQGAADRASQESDRIAAMAQQRALQAISQAGNLGSQIRGQEFGEKSDVAKAKDLINQFNTANQQNVQMRNVGAQNVAQQQNLATQQRIGEQQASMRNQQQQYNKALEQQQFDNQLKKATGQVGASQNLQNIYQQQGSDVGKMWAGVGTGVGQAATGINQVVYPDLYKTQEKK